MPPRTAGDEELGRTDGDGADERPAVVAHTTRPGRTVFTDSANPDGWIATDFTVEPER